MKIAELENRRVKLSAGTITAKNDNGKTAGIVRAARFTDAPPRVQFEYSKAARAPWNSGKANNLYIYENRLYYINNLKTADFYKDPRAAELYPDEITRYNRLLSDITAAGITIINCYC